MGVLGFIFWVFCSHLYNPSDVGIATSLIAAASLVSSFSALGFNNTIIRFLAGAKNKNGQISTAITINLIASICFGAMFVLSATISHNPGFPASHLAVMSGIFIFFVVILSISNLIDSTFIAYRATKYVVMKNTLMSIVKLLLPFAIVGIGFVGIFASVTIATGLAVGLGLFWLTVKFNYRFLPQIDTGTLKETYTFTVGNYLGNLFGMLPGNLVPLIIVSRIGTSEAAFYYMPMMIASFLNIIPSASAQILFAEVAHDEQGLVKHLDDSIRHLFMVLVPAVIAVLLAGPFVLSFFGQAYVANGSVPLYVLAVASMVGALNFFGDTLLNLKKHIPQYVAMNALNAVTIVVLTYVEAPNGLAAIAISNLLGQIVTLVVYLTINWDLVKAHWQEKRLP